MLELTRLVDQQLIITTNAVNLITNPANQSTTILSVKVKNTGNNFVNFWLYRVPDNGGAVGTLSESAHNVSQINLPPNSYWGSDNEWTGKIILIDENDSFWVKVDEANVVNLSIDGVTKT